MDTWRLIPLETRNAFMNMAIDEAILTAHIAKQVPNTLRLYMWKPSAVSIGRNQNPQETVYTDALRKHGVDLVRRISGGGTVFHDEAGEVTYSVIATTTSLGKDSPAVYQRIHEAVTDALRLIGIPADLNQGNEKNCPNLIVAGKKISGSAQAIRHGTVLQHGTILLSVNLPLMFQLLRVNTPCTCAQAAQIAEHKITSIQKELGHPITAETAANTLAQGFHAILKINLEPATLTPYETELAKKLYTRKYATDAWNQNGKTSSA
ncbi:lipoate--protein ligase family protein [Candidatus Bathyarchaeota archaeon A05DMB-2]|jgi:lipoate-protein ligase A|nr:lipoate--protein ligase family protein [Candidatus Bathyarchaeota archaeon A05DMB-2]